MKGSHKRVNCSVVSENVLLLLCELKLLFSPYEQLVLFEPLNKKNAPNLPTEFLAKYSNVLFARARTAFLQGLLHLLQNQVLIKLFCWKESKYM